MHHAIPHKPRPWTGGVGGGRDESNQHYKLAVASVDDSECWTVSGKHPAVALLEPRLTGESLGHVLLQ